MESNSAVLIALLVILTIALVYQGWAWMKSREKPDGFTPGAAGVHQQYPAGPHNPYTVLNTQLDAVRGYRNDSFNQPAFYRHPRGLDRYHRAGAHLSPEQVAEAEREQWYAGLDEGHTGYYNTELAHDQTADTMQYHTASPVIDYDSYVTDLVVDPRTKDNHRRWVEEMKPWSGTAMKVDTLDVENYVDFVGLRRPQAVVQYNPLQLTEVDTMDLSVNPRFNFRG